MHRRLAVLSQLTTPPVALLPLERPPALLGMSIDFMIL